MAREGIEFFTEIKTVFHDYTGSARKTNIHMPPAADGGAVSRRVIGAPPD